MRRIFIFSTNCSHIKLKGPTKDPQMAQQTMLPATKLATLSSIPETYMMEGENKSPWVFP